MRPSYSSVLAWRIPGTREPGGLPSMGSHRVGHDWSDLVAAAAASWRVISNREGMLTVHMGGVGPRRKYRVTQNGRSLGSPEWKGRRHSTNNIYWAPYYVPGTVLDHPHPSSPKTKKQDRVRKHKCSGWGKGQLRKKAEGTEKPEMMGTWP